jgi:4-amino-4-deoxy-L-arabinose transferase-like glycosyltransferase
VPTLAEVHPHTHTRASSHLFVFAICAVVLITVHLPFLSMPYFWDELGQFVPAALDILHRGAWIPQSTTPNVHPPGVMAYLAVVWRVFGYSLPATRVAMLVIASAALYWSFLLSIRLSRGLPGAPAFAAALLLLATPLFYTQAMMAQLDMPAMALTVLSLLLFLDRRYAACAAVTTALVLVKETGAIAPLLFGAWLLFQEKRVREALYFIAPFAALMLWLVCLRHATGNWLGDAGFAHYNVGYALSPVRAAFALLRRLWFLFAADFRWIGTVCLFLAWRRRFFFTREWAIAGAFFALHVIFVSLFGGATLERYLLPVFPILYAAMAAGFAALPRTWRVASIIAMSAGLFAGLFWNPPYPFPYENNLAMVDFVELQKNATEALNHGTAPAVRIATAWPYTGALYNPELLYSRRRFSIVETNDFHPRSVAEALERSPADILVTYSRTWEPSYGLQRFAMVRSFLHTYYDYEPQITSAEIEDRLGFHPLFRFSQRGQWIEVYSK